MGIILFTVQLLCILYSARLCIYFLIICVSLRSYHHHLCIFSSESVSIFYLSSRVYIYVCIIDQSVYNFPLLTAIIIYMYILDFLYVTLTLN